MNAAAKELPVSYDLSKPQEDKEPYVGSVLFFKQDLLAVNVAHVNHAHALQRFKYFLTLAAHTVNTNLCHWHYCHLKVTSLNP